MQSVYLSFPKNGRPPEAGAWEAAIAKRLPDSFAMIVILDRVGERYQVRSAHRGDAGTISDVTPDAERLLREAGIHV